MSRVALLSLLILPLAASGAEPGSPDKARFDRCELAAAGSVSQTNPLLLRRQGSAEAGLCRERVRCTGPEASKPEMLEAFCAAEAGGTCPEALTCVWENHGLRSIPESRPAVLESADHVVTGVVVSFDAATVTVKVGRRTLRFARALAANGGQRGFLDEGLRIPIHLSDEQMLQLGLWPGGTGRVNASAAGRAGRTGADGDRMTLVAAEAGGASHLMKIEE